MVGCRPGPAADSKIVMSAAACEVQIWSFEVRTQLHGPAAVESAYLGRPPIDPKC